MTGNFITNRPPFNASRWMLVSLVSLFFIAATGVLMRYKIGFDFPYFDQKNIQHGHSHFAFAGWVTQTLMVFLIRLLDKSDYDFNIRKYTTVLFANLICSYGMFFSFAAQGYGSISIAFSTLSVLVSFWFCFWYAGDLKSAKHIVQKNWFYAALLFNVLSAGGTVALAYMMGTHSFEQHKYLAAVYWYLHFQYNGWFFFVCAGLFVQHISSILTGSSVPKWGFWLFSSSCIPVYGLSVLWLDLPLTLFTIVAAGAIAQFSGFCILLAWSVKMKVLSRCTNSRLSMLLLFFVTAALTVKLSLQLGSVIPSVSKLAFGFRPIVIAYLHLILLAVISVFLIWYSYTNNILKKSKLTSAAIIIFISGVFFNELMLAIQGIASFSYTLIPDVNFYLFIITLILFTGVVLLLSSQLSKRKLN